MPDITVSTIIMLRSRGYRYARFDKKGTLQAAKSKGEDPKKAKWEDITEKIDVTGSTMRPYTLQVLDLDSF